MLNGAEATFGAPNMDEPVVWSQFNIFEHSIWRQFVAVLIRVFMLKARRSSPRALSVKVPPRRIREKMPHFYRFLIHA
jgi:hypothetical protein